MVKVNSFWIRRVRGFTLLELMIVVIVIGVLATLAIPRFSRAVEKARQSEAYSNLGTLRLSEFRYRAEWSGFTTDLKILDVENPNDILETNRYFSYTVTTDGGLLITATRNSTKWSEASYTITLDEAGTVGAP